MDISLLSAQLPKLLPAIVQWAEEMEAFILKQGKPLEASLIEVAQLVGVSLVGKVHVLELDDFPLPADPVLQQAASALGLLGENTLGLTLGYGILIKRGLSSRQLIAHECRHVHQYEQAGSVAQFLEGYLTSILQVGYSDSPYEVDARQHEIV